MVCAARKSRQVGPKRRGAGSMPAACGISQTVEATMRCPSRAGSPRMRRWCRPWRAWYSSSVPVLVRASLIGCHSLQPNATTDRRPGRTSGSGSPTPSLGCTPPPCTTASAGPATTGWGTRRQDNTWDTDGHTFFARSRLLRWLPEPRVRAALNERDRQALERLCERLPELLPSRPACLTHGDLWVHNILATRDGQPALIDPAVSYMWPEVDLAHLWSSPHPPEAKRFFARYAELTGLDDD